MYVIVYCNEGFDSGLVYLCRELAPAEKLNARAFADHVAAAFDRTIEEPNGYIMNCCGDLRVEFMDHKPRTEYDARNDCERYLGSTCIWSGQSFYFERE